MPHHPDYLKTLLLYHEEEVMGEAYFYGLIGHFSEAHEKEKLDLLARMERYAAESVRPLLEKYGLAPRPDEELAAIGKQSIDRHARLTWPEFVTYMANRYPAYMDEFHALENMGPEEDQPYLKALTNHETAAISFANRELAGDRDSTQPMHQYLKEGTA